MHGARTPACGWSVSGAHVAERDCRGAAHTEHAWRRRRLRTCGAHVGASGSYGDGHSGNALTYEMVYDAPGTSVTVDGKSKEDIIYMLIALIFVTLRYVTLRHYV